MKNLEFRAWNKLEKEMQTVLLIDFANGIAKTLDAENLFECNYIFDDLEIDQKIGRKDKNGKKIFAGDVVRFDVRASFEPDSEPVNNAVGKVSIGDCVSFGVWDIAYCDNIEVIGNFYENPELLETDKWQPIF
jgi:uncharacterized phage protein (TIGR01671 family)